jgi:beta-glucanase (GH16 family)
MDDLFAPCLVNAVKNRQIATIGFFLVALCCSAARADPATQRLFDPASAASVHLHADHSAIEMDRDLANSGPRVSAEANQPYPGLTISPLGGDWNLSAFKGISAEVTNLSSDRAWISLRFDDEADWSLHPNPFDATHLQIEPGATVKLQTLFGESYGTEGFPVNPAKVKQVLLFFDQQADGPRAFLVHNVEAFANADEADESVLQPNMTGLIAWLDASRDGAVQADPRGSVLAWRDRTDLHHDLMPNGGTAGPQLVEGDINGRPAFRFDANTSLALANPLRIARGSVTVIVVWKPFAGQPNNPPVCLATSLADGSVAPDRRPNFQLVAKALAPQQQISFTEQSDVPIGQIIIGAKASPLRADIGEIMVYDRAFLSEGERQVTMNYLARKWGAEVPESGWTRKGDLGQPPLRVTGALPLSDQQNHGKWSLDPAFSDEFKGETLDQKKWRVFSPETRLPADWLGREPAMFTRQNVAIKDGELQLTFRKGDVPAMKNYPGYAGYTSAYVTTRERTGYGYYEICAKPMNSAASAAYWFTDTPDPDHATEIDVFELGGRARGFERNDNMTIHVWSMPNDKRHWGIGGVWHAPWNLADYYHVYGFRWNKDQLVWYVDGVAVHAAKNTNWFFPMRMIFDSEAMWSWFGKVNDADLPSTFRIKYVRVWRSAAPLTLFTP